MNIHDYLIKYTKNINENDICNYDMENFDKFKKFIDNHYTLNHLKNNNYIKYVKVIRQKIVLMGNNNYEILINKINKIFNIMNENHLFYNINFNKYLFNIKKIHFLLTKRENNIEGEIQKFKELYNEYSKNNKIKFQILHTINISSRKHTLFNKYKRELLYLISEFNTLEEKYGIDQKLIDIVNSERKLIGKKSEYNVNNLIKKYIKHEDNSNLYYLENIDIFKLFRIKMNNDICKGEIDGLILKKENDEYIIEYIIEVKSSIKATFEDIYKIIGLKNFFLKYTFTHDIHINDIKLNEKSFSKIINEPIHNWLIYICNDQKNKIDKIDKSHLYFSYILKIIDYDFIKDYYINNNDNIIKKKFKLIIDNQEYINNLFLLWKNHIYLKQNSSCIYILK
tara:strand:+ start:970 stop:2157 length:1188 start_codon:yes stop_codon:yes gene_type:complete